MSTTRIQIATEYGTDLSSRYRAAHLRIDLLQRVTAEGAPQVIDFRDVRTISDSFADEVFGILVIQRGEAWFRENLKFENLPTDVRESILEAIQYRIERHESTPA